MTGQKPMTKGEREELKKLARERARVAKADVRRRSADLRSRFEQQLITLYDYNRDEVWRAAVEEAKAAVEEAQATVAQRCEELGIPAGFAPRLSFTWQQSGPYMIAYEQRDLRRAAEKRIEAQERAAVAEIDKRALEIQTELVVEGLTSERAVAFLKQMPSVVELMPGIDMSELQKQDRKSLGMGDDITF